MTYFRVYIIIVNYKSWQDTIECLESVMKSDYPDFKIIVVDNASPNESVKNLQSWANGELTISSAPNSLLQKLSFPFEKKPVDYAFLKENETAGFIAGEEKLLLIQANENRGFSAGNNIGLKIALKDNSMQYLWLLNNDTVIEPDALRHLIEKMQKDKTIGLCGAKVMYYSNPEIFQCVAGGKYNPWIAAPTPIGNEEIDTGQYDIEYNPKGMYLIMGACTMASRIFIESTGLMGEDYFLYFEEQDWAERGRRVAGWNLGYACKAKIYHKDGTTTGGTKDKTSTSYLSDFYYSRSKILFTSKFYPWCLPTVYLSFLIVMYKRLIRKKPERLIMLLKIMLNPKNSIPVTEKK